MGGCGSKENGKKELPKVDKGLAPQKATPTQNQQKQEANKGPAQQNPNNKASPIPEKKQEKPQQPDKKARLTMALNDIQDVGQEAQVSQFKPGDSINARGKVDIDAISNFNTADERKTKVEKL